MTPHRIAVLVALALVGFNGVMILLMQIVPGFLGMAHFTEPGHRIHDLTFGFIFLPAVIGLLTQLRRPAEDPAGQLMALIPWLALVLTLPLTVLLTSNPYVINLALNLAWIGPATFTVIAAALHPSGRGMFRSLAVSRVDPVMLVLVAAAAIPLLALAYTNLLLQGSSANEHALMGHYGFMAAFAFTVIGVGVLASLRPRDWRPAAWVAGALPVLLGLASLSFRVDSSLDTTWAIAAVVWGIAFVAAAELRRPVLSAVHGPAAMSAKDEPSMSDRGAERDGVPGRGATRTSRAGWAVLLAAAALVLAFVGMHFAGGGIPAH